MRQILVLLAAPLAQGVQMGAVNLEKLDHKILPDSVGGRVAAAGDLDEAVTGAVGPDFFVVAVKSGENLLDWLPKLLL